MSNKEDLLFGAGLWMFGQFVDRYATDAYGPPVGVLEAIDKAGQVGELVALDINYPFDSGVSIDQVRAALERNKLRCYAITPASYTRKFQKGTLEFLHALRRIDWNQEILLDQFPFRENPVAAARESIRTMRQLDALLDHLDLKTLESVQGRQDALGAQRLVLDLFLDRD